MAKGGRKNGSGMPRVAPSSSGSGGTLLATGWYNKLRLHVVPPLFVLLFTGAVQWLGLLGGLPCPLDLTQCPRLAGNSFSWTLVSGYVAWVVLWLRVPSKQFIGPESPEGERPRYQDNGLLFYGATLVACVLAQARWPWLAHEVVASFPELLASLNLLALVLCAWLVITARLKGVGGDMPLLYDFYRGAELHPRVLGCDAKQLAVSRMGMSLWQLLALAACAASQHTPADLLTLLMQTVYIAKFYWWEAGYFTTLDITYDRAGYYLCWGGFVLMPALFPLSQLHLAAHPSAMATSSALACCALCLAATALEFTIDRQKEVFVKWRQEYAKGKARPYQLWGRPVQFIDASYETTQGLTRRTALLTSGFWGLARHCNYTCELAVALLWSLPAATQAHSQFVPLLYFFFIAGLIAHRILRDEHKCSAKYGRFWTAYCARVPHRFVPYLF